MTTTVTVPLDYDTELEATRVGDSLLMPIEFLVISECAADGPDVVLRVEIRDGAPTCREIRFRSKNDGREVRRSDLKALEVENLLESGASKACHWVTWEQRDLVATILPDELDEDMKRRAMKQVRGARRTHRRQVTDELLENVAQVYRSNVSHHPTQAVAQHFGKAHRTAALYVRRARDAGFLGRALPGKAGEDQ